MGLAENEKEVASLNPCFNHYEDERPYAVVFDVLNIETGETHQGEDWSYFKTEKEAKEFVKQFNIDGKHI